MSDYTEELIGISTLCSDVFVWFSVYHSVPQPCAMVTIFCIGSILWSTPWYFRITYIFAPFNYVGLMKRSIYALQFVNVQNCRMGKCVNKVHDQRFTALRGEMYRIIESLRQTLLFLESFAILYILYNITEKIFSSKNIHFHWSTPMIMGMTLQLRALFNLYAHAPSQLWDYMFRKKTNPLLNYFETTHYKRCESR